jgi:uncharacterized membrane protein YqjE
MNSDIFKLELALVLAAAFLLLALCLEFLYSLWHRHRLRQSAAALDYMHLLSAAPAA